MSDPRIELVCLDMAGTTVADDGVVETAFLAALESCGVTADDDRRPAMLTYVRDTMGTSKIEVFRALFGDEAAERANVAFEAAYARHLDSGSVAPIPDAEAVIDALRGAGIRVALITGFSAPTRDRLVAALGWEQIADLLLCPAEAGRGRPYPDLVLTAMLRLKTSAVQAVAVVGDTAADVECGIRSGARLSVGVLTGADPAERLVAAGATQVLGSVAELPGLIGI